MLLNHSISFHFTSDHLVKLFLTLCAGTAISIVLLIFFFLFKESVATFENIGVMRFVSDESWYPTDGEFNIVPMLLGSLLLMTGAVMIGAPIALSLAIIVNFYAGKHLTIFLKRLVEIAAAVPSVVYGLWGMLTLVPLIATIKPPGTSLLSGIVVLSLMVIPTITIISDTAIRNVPSMYVKNAVALGFKKWAVILSVVIPAAKTGIFTSLLLGAARALGETMVVLMITGNVVQIPGSFFDPLRALTSNIALEMAYAMDEHRGALFVSGLTLLIFTFVLVMINEKITSKEIK